MVPLRWRGSPGCFGSSLQSVCIVGSGVLNILGKIDICKRANKKERSTRELYKLIVRPNKTFNNRV